MNAESGVAASLTRPEMGTIMALDTPSKLQTFIDTLTYTHHGRIAIIDVLRKRQADCLEAACFASFVFTLHHIPSFILDLSCRGNDDDHVICVFRESGLYGAVAQSKYLGLKYRNPVYRNIRELSMSYFENYFNFKGEFDLLERSHPQRIKETMLYSAESTRKIEDKLSFSKHVRLVPRKICLPPASREKFRRELIIVPRDAKIAQRYR